MKAYKGPSVFKSALGLPLILHRVPPRPIMTRPALRFPLGLVLAAALLGGCEQLGIPDPAKSEAKAEADGKAIGSACRHAGRAIEDCFTLNPAAPRAAIFAGWKDMNDYMAENKIAEVAPQLPPPPPPGAAKPGKKSAKAKPEGEGEAETAKGEAPDKTAEAPAAEAETPRKRRRSAE